MAGVNRSKLVRITVHNIGCIGNDGVEIELDNVACLVGKNNAGKSTVLRAYELAKGSAVFDLTKDRCQYAPEDQPSEVLLEVHILVFNRGTDTSTVLNGIETATRAHKNFKRAVTWSHESGFRYIFHSNEDTNREMTVTVLVFHVPK